ncbi:MAG: type II toxin-antitoxin system PemK/MazF family toxin [Acidobacteria bacterium]|nr:type II toxin-antitoxin system PemK/MazF family toxin [Acidobacteriota bacterium]
MNVQRGEIVLVDYPYATGGGTKVRPVLVIQNNRDNQRLTNTIVAQITGLTRRSLEATQLLIALATPEGRQSGLRQDSVVNCVNLLTLDKNKILMKLGSLPNAQMQRVNDCLKAALELP